MSINQPLKRISEDAKLRPFLSSHFDKQTFIKKVIKDNKTEEYLTDITSCVDDIKVEIKGYISKHTEQLMSGMSDFASLADRYQTLSKSSQTLHKKVDRLKTEAVDMHDMVKNRTSELERIHATSISLRLLRQFSHAKAQLDQFKLSNGKFFNFNY